MRRARFLRAAALSAVSALLAAVAPAAAQSGGVTPIHLRLGIGARAGALGGAYTAVAEGAEAVYWNPAALAVRRRREVSALYMRPSFEDAHYNFFAYRQPLGEAGGIGAGVVWYGVDGVDVRTVTGVQTGSLDFSTTDLMLGYGRPIGTDLSVGVTLHRLDQSIGQYKDAGYGADLGLLWRGMSETARIAEAYLARTRARVQAIVDPLVAQAQEAYGGGGIFGGTGADDPDSAAAILRRALVFDPGNKYVRGLWQRAAYAAAGTVKPAPDEPPDLDEWLEKIGIGRGEGDEEALLRRAMEAFDRGDMAEADLALRALQRVSRSGQFAVGLLAQNVIAPSLTLKKKAEDQPRNYRIGLAYRTGRLLLAADYDLPELGSGRPHVGLEYRLGTRWALRAGLDDDDVVLGLGITHRSARLDYTYLMGEDVGPGDAHRVGLSVAWGEEKEYVTAEMIGRAEAALARNRITDARTTLEQATLFEPDHPVATARLQEVDFRYRMNVEQPFEAARLAAEAGRLEEAVPALRGVLAFDPTHEPSRLLLAEIEPGVPAFIEEHRRGALTRFGRGEHAEALAEIERVLQLSAAQENVDVRDRIRAALSTQENRRIVFEEMQEGISFYVLGDIERAIPHFEAVAARSEKARRYLDQAREVAGRGLDPAARADRAARRLASADAATAEGRPEESLEEVHHALALDPRSRDAIDRRDRLEAAARARWGGRVKEAEAFRHDLARGIRILEDVLDENPKHDSALALLALWRDEAPAYAAQKVAEGTRALEEGDAVSGLRAFAAALVADPTNAEAERGRGRARAYLRAPIDAVLESGRAALEDDRIDSAVEVAAQALAIDPEDEPAVAFRKEVENEVSRRRFIAETENRFRMALARIRDRDFEGGHSLLREVMERNKEHVGARAALDLLDERLKARERNQALAAAFAEGLGLFQEGRFAEALDRWAPVVEQEPGRGALRIYMARARDELSRVRREVIARADAQYRAGNLGSALESYRAVLKADPENVRARSATDEIQPRIRLLVEGYRAEADRARRAGGLDALLRAVSEISRLDPSDADARGEAERLTAVKAHVAAGERAFAEGRLAEAAGAFGDALALDPSLDRAREMRDRALSALKAGVDEAMQAGVAALTARDYDRAVVNFEAVVALQPANEAARRYLDEARGLSEAAARTRAEEARRLAAARAAAPAARVLTSEDRRQVTRYINDGIEQYRAGNLQAAIAAWSRALAIDPKDPTALSYRARAEKKLARVGGGG